MLPQIAHPSERPTDCLLRVAVWGDLHMKADVADWYPEKLTKTQEIATDLGADCWLQTGDWWGGHDTGHVTTMFERIVFFPVCRGFSTIGPGVGIGGNHDPDQEVDTLSNLASTFPMHMVTESGPRRMVVKDRPVYVWCLCYPHRGHMAAGRTFASTEVETATLEAELKGMLADWGDAIADLREDEPDSVHIVMTHVSLRGASPDNTVIRHPSGDITVSPQDLVDTGADLVVCGHEHGPRLYGGRCLGVGSTRHLGHGESGEERFFWIIDICAGQRAGDLLVDGERIQHVINDDRGSVIATGYPTGAPRWITVKARWTGERFEHGPVLERAAGAEVRLDVDVPEEHLATLPPKAAWKDAILGNLPVFGCGTTQRTQRAERETRAPEVLSVKREDPVGLLDVWLKATTGTGISSAQAERVRRNLREKERDPVEVLALAHPGLAEVIRNAGRGK